MRRLLARLWGAATGRRDEERLREEIEEHIARQTEDNLRLGMSAGEARRQALLRFGGVEATKEAYRDQRGLPFVETLIWDTRHALRRLRRAPAFTISVMLTLALGIGAITSIFTLVHAVLLKSLPVSKPEQLYRLGRETHCCVYGGYGQTHEFSIVSYDLYEYFRDHTRGFEELAAFRAGGMILGVRRAGKGSAAEGYLSEFVSGNYFAMFGIGAYAGRALRADDDRRGAPPVAMMSYRAWRQKYGLDRAVIGGAFNINDAPFTIVGVTPPGFFGDTLRDSPTDFFLPLATEPLVQRDSSLLNFANLHWLESIGRVRAGANVSSIEAQMRVELQQWLGSHVSEMDPNERAELPKQTLYLSPGGSGITSMREIYERRLQTLLIVSGFVLLIVCANVANLMLVRGLERRQQTSLSMALGARPMRLIRQALTESLVLALLGGAAGLGVAYAGTRLILATALRTLTVPPISASPSGPVLLFVLGVSLLTGVAFGAAPAWMAVRVDPIEAIRGGNRSTRRAGSGARKTLAVAQAALSLVLLCVSGLLIATLYKLEHRDFGFEQEGRTVVSIDPVLAGYKPERLDGLYRRIEASFAGVAGVSGVASCLYSPQQGDNWNDSVYVDGRPAPGPADDINASWDRVSAGYFQVIGNPILRGRAISEQDTAGSRHVAVVNEAFARKFFRDEDPIGKRFRRSEIGKAGDFEIVGVAKDARYLSYNLDQPVNAFFFVPASQLTAFATTEDNSGETRSRYMHDIVIRTQAGVGLTDAQVRRTMADVDPNLPVVFVQSLRQQVEGNLAQQRLLARLTSLFGMIALILASLGVYGVTAYSVGSRTNEIGVRMALGADRRKVLGLIVRGALGLIGAGLVLGAPLTLAAGRLLGSQLYGVKGSDPAILGGGIAVLAFATLIAALIPALRASLISPVEALRAE